MKREEIVAKLLETNGRVVRIETIINGSEIPYWGRPLQLHAHAVFIDGVWQVRQSGAMAPLDGKGLFTHPRSTTPAIWSSSFRSSPIYCAGNAACKSSGAHFTPLRRSWRSNYSQFTTSYGRANRDAR